MTFSDSYATGDEDWGHRWAIKTLNGAPLEDSVPRLIRMGSYTMGGFGLRSCG